MNLKLTLIIIAVCSIFSARGQDRINEDKLVFDGYSDTLKNSTGWVYNSSLGEWIDYENVFCSDKQYKEYGANGTMMSKRLQNFIYLTTRTVTVDSTKYYVLIVKKWKGLYKYPSIYKDWTVTTDLSAYIFPKDEFEKLYNFEKELVLVTDDVVTPTDKDNLEELLARVKYKIKNNYDSKYLQEFFPIMRAENGAIRFYLPERFENYDYDFNKMYFETDSLNFSKLFIN